MTIEKQTVKHLAMLSRLKFNEEEIQGFTNDLDEIFEYANSLQKVDTDGIEPSAHAILLQNVFKKDEIKTYDRVDDLVKNGPDIENHSFKVPRILTN